MKVARYRYILSIEGDIFPVTNKALARYLAKDIAKLRKVEVRWARLSRSVALDCWSWVRGDDIPEVVGQWYTEKP